MHKIGEICQHLECRVQGESLGELQGGQEVTLADVFSIHSQFTAWVVRRRGLGAWPAFRKASSRGDGGFSGTKCQPVRRRRFGLQIQDEALLGHPKGIGERV